MKITINDMLSRMIPTTMVAFLGDLVEAKSDWRDGKIISMVANELLANAGEDAIMMLSEAGVEHELIDCEIAMWREEKETEVEL